MAWYALSEQEVVKSLQTDARTGLDDREAAARLQRYGTNRIPDRESRHWYHMLAGQFANVLILILIVAAFLSWLIGDAVDALAILLIVLINGLLGFVQEWKAESALAGLKKMLSPQCTVLRDGKTRQIDTGALVPGDYVLLQAGNMVPADIRLLHTVNMKVDEAALTGESVPAEKDPAPVEETDAVAGRTNMVFMGTNIAGGRGHGLVVATGAETEFGRIAGLTGEIRETKTRLQRQLGILGRQLSMLALTVAAAMIVIGWLAGKPLLEMMVAGISLAVAAVPEGLPAVVTITLAIGVSIMARQKAIMRHLPAAETLGATSVICTDKTGTLTRNEMTLQKLWLPDGMIDISGTGYSPEGTFSRDGKAIDPAQDKGLSALLYTGRFCNYASIVREQGQWRAAGSATEAAFIVAAEKAGIASPDPEALCGEFPFDSTRKRMAMVEQKRQGERIVHVKGAPEVLLALSDYIVVNGTVQPLDDTWRGRIEKAFQDLAGQGLRTMALARKTVEPGTAIDQQMAESRLTFLGVAGIIDPPRPEVREALSLTQSAGIRVLMVTGDSPDTALAVARQIGLKADKAMTGSDLAALDDAALAALLKQDIVFARTVPEDKFRIVKLLQADGHLVAMTGDGVNDAPALKQADIGIAMGIRGTDVARGAADMVLSDDNFASIVKAVEEGRRQYENIGKFVRYLTSSNIGETLAIFCAVLFGWPLILIPIQILWVNLVTDSITALSLSLEKAERDIMTRPPRELDRPILDRRAMMMLGLFGSYIGIVTLGLFYYYLDQDYRLANTVAFTVMVITANIHTLNFRSLQAPLSVKGWLSNPWLLAAMAIMLGLQLCAVYLPGLQHILKTVPLGPADWLMVAVVSLPLFIAPEIYKTVKYKKRAG
ncbi:MAG: HAD-IC family P-type ATPase [Rhodospirillales bacterium]|nr:HAD-IC family P-type ATPase [Rhodospirillales bacterium]MCB9996784.1 HAD-IC family P-type ATPase [Rhodospirillales bacterium]